MANIVVIFSLFSLAIIFFAYAFKVRFIESMMSFGTIAIAGATIFGVYTFYDFQNMKYSLDLAKILTPRVRIQEDSLRISVHKDVFLITYKVENIGDLPISSRIYSFIIAEIWIPEEIENTSCPHNDSAAPCIQFYIGMTSHDSPFVTDMSEYDEYTTNPGNESFHSAKIRRRPYQDRSRAQAPDIYCFYGVILNEVQKPEPLISINHELDIEKFAPGEYMPVSVGGVSTLYDGENRKLYSDFCSKNMGPVRTEGLNWARNNLAISEAHLMQDFFPDSAYRNLDASKVMDPGQIRYIWPDLTSGRQ